MVALEKHVPPFDGLHRPPGPAAAPAPVESDEASAIDYPDSDGEPLSDNTLQLAWIVLIYTNLDALLPWFVAGDLLWYPVEGRPDIRLAPDVLVALDRPKGYRGSYMQFREDGVPPTVVFEVLSPRNTLAQMMRKAVFYLGHGAKEFIVIDPDLATGWALLRTDDGDPSEVVDLDGWVSPALQIRFARHDGKLEVYRPDGTAFRSLQDAEAAAQADRERAERLAARLAALGVDPSEI